MAKKHRLAELQLAIMQVLWDRGDSTVAQVRVALRPQRELAHTTVGTMLAKMENHGYVGHQTRGKANVYHAIIERDSVTQSMVSDLANRLFSGDIKQMVCQLLDDDELSRDDLAELRRMIQRRERELKND